MSIGRYESLWLDGSLGAMAAALHSPVAGKADAPKVLLAPPLLHEQHRSHRFYCEVASSLAALGMTCLRFCYGGTSDSQGDGSQVSVRSLLADLDSAAGALAPGSHPGPLFVFGFQSAALVVAAWMDKSGIDATAVLWEPVCDGAPWLEDLQDKDRIKRNIISRLSGDGASTAMIHDGHLMGLPAESDFLASVAALAWPRPPTRLRAWSLQRGGDDATGQGRWQRRFELPASIPEFETSVLMDASLTFTPAMEQAVKTLGRAMLGER